MKQVPQKTQTHDPEETRGEQAKRLITGDVGRLASTSQKLRKRLRLHAAHLSPADRRILIDYVRRDSELTLGVLDDIGQELPGFSFPSDHIDGEWS